MPAIVDEHGKELEGACEGFLVTIKLNCISIVFCFPLNSVKTCFNYWLNNITHTVHLSLRQCSPLVSVLG